MPSQSKEIQSSDKKEARGIERTRPGAVFVPAVDILESEEAITVLADLPGVKADALEIDVREGVLTISADASSPAGESERDVLREFDYGGFYRQFALAESIDVDRIDAKLSDGVLHLELPKVEKAKPRKIEVKAM